MKEINPIEFLSAVIEAVKDPNKHAEISRLGEREAAISRKHAEAIAAAKSAAADKSEAQCHRAQSEKARDEVANDLARRIAETETAYQFQIKRDEELTQREGALLRKAKEVTDTEATFSRRERELDARQRALAEQEADLKKRIDAFNRKIKAYEAA